MIDLNTIRHEMAQYMLEHPRGSLDSAIFHVVKLAYNMGVNDSKQHKQTYKISRIDVIGQNGNEGLHYMEAEDGKRS